MSQITWADKVTLDAQPDIARINKVIDDDMNEIKFAHNDTDYVVSCLITNSITENLSGEIWIDNKLIYKKVINTGQILSQNKSVAHNISNLDTVISIKGIAISSDGNFYTLPRIEPSAVEKQIAIYVTSTDVKLQVGSNANFDSSFVILEYTKQSS